MLSGKHNLNSSPFCMVNIQPRVSIGLPVYNGEEFLAEALESVLAQTFTQFEVVICDNASTDGTAGICSEFGRRDPRIRYLRNDKNLGAAPNYNRTFELATGEYFKWLAHDDFIAPTFLERCVEALDNNPEAVLVCPLTVFVDIEGTVVVKEIESIEPLRLSDSSARLTHLLYDTDRHCVFGLIRSSVLRSTPLIGNYTDSDGNLLIELCLHGPFLEVPTRLLFLREHRQRSIYAHGDFQSRDEWFDTSKVGKMNFPAWRAIREYQRSLARVPLPFVERRRSYATIANWVLRHRWRVLGGQVKQNLKRRLRPSNRRQLDV